MTDEAASGAGAEILTAEAATFRAGQPEEREESRALASSLEGEYGKGKLLPEERKASWKMPGDWRHLKRSWRNSRDPTEELKDVWVGWPAIGAPIAHEVCAIH